MELTTGWVDADRLRTALGFLEREKLALVACMSPPSGTLTTGGCLACPIWLSVAVSVPDVAAALPASTEFMWNKYQTFSAADLIARGGVVVMGGQGSSSSSYCASLYIKLTV